MLLKTFRKPHHSRIYMYRYVYDNYEKVKALRPTFVKPLVLTKLNTSFKSHSKKIRSHFKNTPGFKTILSL